MWRRWRWIFWGVWYDLHSDLTRLHSRVARDARAELPEYGRSRSCQGPRLISLSKDNAGGDISAQRHGAAGVIHDGKQGF